MAHLEFPDIFPTNCGATDEDVVFDGEVYPDDHLQHALQLSYKEANNCVPKAKSPYVDARMHIPAEFRPGFLIPA